MAEILTRSEDVLAPCPICASDEVEEHYARTDSGDWCGCLNCEATAPYAVWVDLVQIAIAFRAR